MDEIEERGGHTCFVPDIEICDINFCSSDSNTGLGGQESQDSSGQED